jgi:predicted transcriptional regulator
VTEKVLELTALSAKELELIERVARRDGISIDEAATNLGKAGLARRVKKRTGKNPAKVYSIKRR